MKTIGISIDYSNICKNYHTAYLDRDNTDKETTQCMKQVVLWTKEFLSDLIESFEYNLYQLNSPTPVKIDDIASKRFLFYSLEKGITLQSFIIQKEYTPYHNPTDWGTQNKEGLLIQNDEEGEGIYLYYNNQNTTLHQWITKKLENFSLDEALL
jgi:hypothetical protein